MEIRAQIINRLYEALEAIDAPLDLLQIVGSWGDTVSEEENAAADRRLHLAYDRQATTG